MGVKFVKTSKDRMAAWCQSGGARSDVSETTRGTADEGLAASTSTGSVRGCPYGPADEGITASQYSFNPDYCADEAMTAGGHTSMFQMCRFGPADEAVTASQFSARRSGCADEGLSPEFCFSAQRNLQCAPLTPRRPNAFIRDGVRAAAKE